VLLLVFTAGESFHPSFEAMTPSKARGPETRQKKSIHHAANRNSGMAKTIEYRDVECEKVVTDVSPIARVCKELSYVIITL
jgi:hypothetical protein